MKACYHSLLSLNCSPLLLDHLLFFRFIFHYLIPRFLTVHHLLNFQLLHLSLRLSPPSSLNILRYLSNCVLKIPLLIYLKLTVYHLYAVYPLPHENLAQNSHPTHFIVLSIPASVSCRASLPVIFLYRTDFFSFGGPFPTIET